MTLCTLPTLIRMFLFSQFRGMHQQYLLINTVTFSIFKYIVLWTSKPMHHCIAFGGKPGITNTDLFYFIVQYNELPSVKTCHHTLLSDYTKRKLRCLSCTFIFIGSRTICRQIGKQAQCANRLNLFISASSSHVIKFIKLIYSVFLIPYVGVHYKNKSFRNRDKM